MSKVRVLEFLLFAFFLGASIFVLVYPTSLEAQLIPTLTNGMATSTGLVVSFTGILLTLSFSILKLDAQQHRKRLLLTVGILGAAIALLWTTYFSLFVGDSYLALKVSLVGLLISLVSFLDLLMFIYHELIPERRAYPVQNHGSE